MLGAVSSNFVYNVPVYCSRKKLPLDIENIESWAGGDYCVSLKMLELPHKELYSFILAMLWLSLSSLLSLAKYFYQYASILWPGRRCHAAMLN